MKFKDLTAVIELYKSKRGFFRRKQSYPAAIERLVTLYNAEDDKEKNIPDAVIRNLLAFHWQEIRPTSRSYLRSQNEFKATEQAYIHLAALLEGAKESAPLSYIQIATLMPGIPSYTRNINFRRPLTIVGGRVFHYDAFVEELNELDNIQNLTALSDALKNYDHATVTHLHTALSALQPIGSAEQQADLQKLKTVFTQLTKRFDTIRALQENPEALARSPMLLNDAPPRYLFKDQDNLEFDIRYLFFTGFKNPITGQAFSATDFAKLMSHPVLGQHIVRFRSMNNMFVPSMNIPQEIAPAMTQTPGGMLMTSALSAVASMFSEMKHALSTLSTSFNRTIAVDFREFDFRTFSEKRDSITPAERQLISSHLSALLVLSDCLQEDNFLQDVSDSEVKGSLTKFIANTAPHKINLLSALTKVPSRYAFKAADNVEIDMRILFFNGFVSPVTGQAFSEVDLNRIAGLPVLGTLITQLKDMNDPFVLPASDEYPEIDFRKFDFKAFSECRDGIPLSRRQQVYAQISALVELSDHLHFENYLQIFPDDVQLKKYITQFAAEIAPLREKILWNEMGHAQFFLKARPILDAMKVVMGGDWDASTVNFFLAMKEFSENPEAVVKRAAGSYIRSNNEYVVRVDAIKQDVDAVRALKDLVNQFKKFFELAYRDDCLRALMQGMTPSGICIAEKMLHLGSSFAVRASLGSNRLATLDDVFADVMAKARKHEISLFTTWGGSHFLEYIMKNHKGKTAYVDENGKKQFLGEKEIRSYLRDIIGYEDVAAYVEPKSYGFSRP